MNKNKSNYSLGILRICLSDIFIFLLHLFNIIVALLLVFYNDIIFETKKAFLSYSALETNQAVVSNGSYIFQIGYKEQYASLALCILTSVVVFLMLFYLIISPKKSGVFLIIFGLSKLNEYITFFLSSKVILMAIWYMNTLQEGSYSLSIQFNLIFVILSTLFPLFLILEGVLLLLKKNKISPEKQNVRIMEREETNFTKTSLWSYLEFVPLLSCLSFGLLGSLIIELFYFISLFFQHNEIVMYLLFIALNFVLYLFI
ncbi:MAG: hypothetical protein ACTSQE_12460, partial [Candidatus Heimdallarchaeaceae archaeon]